MRPPAAPDTHAITTSLWAILKTFLFTTVRLVDCVLKTLLFVSPPPITLSTAASLSHPRTTFDLTRTALRTLSYLSFIFPRFGGVSSTASSALPELLRTFYTGLDVLSSDAEESQHFVREICAQTSTLGRVEEINARKGVLLAKQAFALASVEQLVPVLGDCTIRTDVYPLCEPYVVSRFARFLLSEMYRHLNDPTHRETYESAHSVMLAIFSAHAKAQKAGVTPTIPNASIGTKQLSFAEQIIPAYARCLVSVRFLRIHCTRTVGTD